MADDVDRAAEREANARAGAEAALREIVDVQKRRAESFGVALHCQDCGEDIPEQRRQAVFGCTRCVPCQQQAERDYYGR